MCSLQEFWEEVGWRIKGGQQTSWKDTALRQRVNEQVWVLFSKECFGKCAYLLLRQELDEKIFTTLMSVD